MKTINIYENYLHNIKQNTKTQLHKNTFSQKLNCTEMIFHKKIFAQKCNAKIFDKGIDLNKIMNKTINLIYHKIN